MGSWYFGRINCKCYTENIQLFCVTTSLSSLHHFLQTPPWGCLHTSGPSLSLFLSFSTLMHCFKEWINGLHRQFSFFRISNYNFLPTRIHSYPSDAPLKHTRTLLLLIRVVLIEYLGLCLLHTACSLKGSPGSVKDARSPYGFCCTLSPGWPGPFLSPLALTHLLQPAGVRLPFETAAGWQGDCGDQVLLSFCVFVCAQSHSGWCASAVMRDGI